MTLVAAYGRHGATDEAALVDALSGISAGARVSGHSAGRAEIGSAAMNYQGVLWPRVDNWAARGGKEDARVTDGPWHFRG